MKLHEINFGDFVEDLTTGVRGLVVCKAQWKNGCDKVIIQPKVKDPKEVKTPDTIWVDIQDVKILKRSKPVEREVIGGPQRIPR